MIYWHKSFSGTKKREDFYYKIYNQYNVYTNKQLLEKRAWLQVDDKVNVRMSVLLLKVLIFIIGFMFLNELLVLVKPEYQIIGVIDGSLLAEFAKKVRQQCPLLDRIFWVLVIAMILFLIRQIILIENNLKFYIIETILDGRERNILHHRKKRY